MAVAACFLSPWDSDKLRQADGQKISRLGDILGDMETVFGDDLRAVN